MGPSRWYGPADVAGVTIKHVGFPQ